MPHFAAHPDATPPTPQKTSTPAESPCLLQRNI
jgi:hypothetical protein